MNTMISPIAAAKQASVIDEPPPRRETRFGRIGFGELRERKASAPDFVVEDWMVRREVSFLAGESEAGKTFLAIDVAMRIALGWPVFDRQTKPGLVIYQIGESAHSLINLRIPAWVSHFGQELPERVPFEILPAKINLWTQETDAKNNTAQLLATIKGIAADYPDIPISAIFIDTLNKAMTGGDEISGKDMGRVIANAELIAQETGAHVAILHHFPKGGHTLRGHGSLRGDVFSVAMVSMDAATKIRTISLDKLKDGEKRSMQFELMQVRLGEREDGKPITSCVVLPVGQKEAARKQQDLGYRLRNQEPIFFRALMDALTRYGTSPPSHIKLRGRADRWVEYDEVKRIYASLMPYDGDPDADARAREDGLKAHHGKLKTQLTRCRKFLMQEGVDIIDVQGKMIWWTGRVVRDFKETYPIERAPPSNPVADEMAAGGDLIDLI